MTRLGYVDGRNVAIEFRHANNHYDRLPGLAADFARRRLAVIVAINTPPALAAKSAAANVSTVFMVADDPVKLGLETLPKAKTPNADNFIILFPYRCAFRQSRTYVTPHARGE